MDFTDSMGMDIVYRDEEKSEVKMKIRDYFYNGINAIHGGVLFTLADTATGVCANFGNNGATTLNSSFDFLKPVLEGEFLYAYAKKIKRGKTISVYSVEIFDDNENLKAHGTFTYYTLRRWGYGKIIR